MPTSFVPNHLNSLTPLLTIKNSDQAINFYQKAFGAELVSRIDAPDGKVMHAELRVGNSIFFLSDELAGRHAHSPSKAGESSIHLELYVENVDRVFKQALDAGAHRSLEPANMFWGDRYGQIVDPFGFVWGIATHLEDITKEEEKQRAHDYWVALAGSAN